ncbi:MAG TPA: universal stress protein [Gaiellaceae bacterium]|nr:universal stress protein [Gaiellaceae bacterium]
MTRKLDRILIAVDDTQSAGAALEQGLALAVDEGAQVIFVNVASIIGDQFIPGDGKPDRVPDREHSVVLTAAAALADALGVPYTTELLVGYAPAQIAALADDLDVDLVVVGSQRRSGLKRFLLGSTSRALIGELARPLLVVPEPAAA